MKVVVTGHSGDYPEDRWWYADYIGHVFEAYEDPKHSDLYLTVEPVFNGLQGNIKKTDCDVLSGKVASLRNRRSKRSG